MGELALLTSDLIMVSLQSSERRIPYVVALRPQSNHQDAALGEQRSLSSEAQDNILVGELASGLVRRLLTPELKRLFTVDCSLVYGLGISFNHLHSRLAEWPPSLCIGFAT